MVILKSRRSLIPFNWSISRVNCEKSRGCPICNWLINCVTILRPWFSICCRS
ncbi:hypothetical protein THIOM_000181 [Candidatus Thiomargarita nelsonii]|uniref:Uncharacterized protein n=1 Tax=Candidatus Thiomargarita nelsonii TaxID=1003181 RepID=A0A176S783_9GAMM|nr:hypothetical protein THIOM_000181 [Candidatus Thiomargarita nelsonii]